MIEIVAQVGVEVEVGVELEEWIVMAKVVGHYLVLLFQVQVPTIGLQEFVGIISQTVTTVVFSIYNFQSQDTNIERSCKRARKSGAMEFQSDLKRSANPVATSFN